MGNNRNSMRAIERPALQIAIIILAGILVYSNTMGVPFQFDDHDSITENPLVKNPAAYLSLEGLRELPTGEIFLRRILGYFTFAINFRLGGLEVAGYHAFNLGVHIAAAVILYMLAWILISELEGHTRQQGIFKYAPLLSGLVYVTHPVATQAVTYIVQRLASLSAMLYLLSVLLYTSARTGRRPARLLHSLSVISALLCTFTKETAFTLPVTILLVEFLVLKNRRGRKALHLLPYFLIASLIPLMVLTGSFGIAETGGARLDTDLSRWRYMLTELGVIATYLRLLFLPVNQSVDYAYPLSASLLDPRTLGSLLLILAIILLSLMNLRRPANSMRLLPFGVLWFFITLAPESGLVPIGDVIFEHRVYLPLAGFSIALSVGGLSAAGKISVRKLLALLSIVPILFSIYAYERNGIWKSEKALWQDAAVKAPLKPRTHTNLGLALLEEGDPVGALSAFGTALGLDPKNAASMDYMGSAYLAMGRTKGAIESFRNALALKPAYAQGHFNMAVALQRAGKEDEAIDHYEAALRLMPNLAAAHNNLALIYEERELYDQAAMHYRLALKAAPEMAEAHLNLGFLMLRGGRVDEARAEFLETMRLRPGDPQAAMFLRSMEKTGK